MASACSDAKQRSVEANDREAEDLLTKNYLPISVDGEGNLLAEDLAAFYMQNSTRLALTYLFSN